MVRLAVVGPVRHVEVKHYIARHFGGRTLSGSFPFVVLVLLALLPCTSAAQGPDTPRNGSPETWWVFFSDRGPDLEARLLARTDELEDSPSIGRRHSAGLYSADVLDLEPWEGYATAIEQAVGEGTIRTDSRYLNAVSIHASEDQVRGLLELPFVTEVRPVATSTFSMPVLTALGPASPGLSGFQLSQIGLDLLHERGWTGEGITMGLLDTGFQLDHEVFGSLLVVDQYDFVNDDPDPSQQEGDPPGQANHGTAVLSAIGGFNPGTYLGGAYGASFLLAKTEDTSGEYEEEEDYWVAGLEWAEQNGADLVSSSLGYIDWYSYEDLDGNTAVTTIAADAAASRGMPVCNSIGNRGPEPGTMNAPADGDSVFSIGAVDAQGTVASFSSRGPTYDGRIKPSVCAMGVSVALAGVTSGYYTGNGTSFSAPLCASASAVIAEAHPEWSMLEVMWTLEATASHAEAPDNDTGHGIVDAYSALLHRSVTGAVRESLTGELLPDYPVSVSIGDTLLTVMTNTSGWFAICPGEFGPFTVGHGGGQGSVIPVQGTLGEDGVEVTVYVDGDPTDAVPTVYPNPTTGRAYVGFDLRNGPVDVTLRVFDILGALVHTETRSAIGPGTFRAPLPGEAFNWDGTDGSGERVATGLYIITLDHGDGIDLLNVSVIR